MNVINKLKLSRYYCHVVILLSIRNTKQVSVCLSVVCTFLSLQLFVPAVMIYQGYLLKTIHVRFVSTT